VQKDLNDMAKKSVVLTLAAIVFTIAFYFFFMTTNHDPVFSRINPFGNDPYDSIGSFGVIISGFLSIFAIVRTVLLVRKSTPTKGQTIFLARTQAAVPVAAFITLVGDLIAMARHPSTWLGQAGENELLLMIASMLFLATLLVLLICRSTREYLQADSRQWRSATFISLVAVAILALYPEALIHSTLGELFSLAIGIFLLFPSMSAWIVALLPTSVEEFQGDRKPGWLSRGWVQWAAVAICGVGLGIFLLIGESLGSKGGTALPVRILVFSIFIGASLLGLVVAYTFLRKPLGLL
jgi:hypothetical protein